MFHNDKAIGKQSKGGGSVWKFGENYNYMFQYSLDLIHHAE